MQTALNQVWDAAIAKETPNATEVIPAPVG
jgi:hypothetical protein